MSSSIRLRQLAIAVTAAVAAVGCGVSSTESDATAGQYFASFGYNYVPAGSKADLAAQSELVVKAKLVSVEDGSYIGDSPDDETASRTARLTFRSEAHPDPIVLQFPRPRNISPAEIEKLVADFDQYVLYLRQPGLSENSLKYMFNYDPTNVWALSTPQGFLVEADGRVTNPLEDEKETIFDGAQSLDDFLPEEGEKTLR